MQPTAYIRMVDAQIRYYMHADPGLLSDHEWAAMFNDLVWIRTEESKGNTDRP
jgi:hypothetical protein